VLTADVPTTPGKRPRAIETRHKKATSRIMHEVAKVQGEGAPKHTYPTEP